jgi:hypothetical protein
VESQIQRAKGIRQTSDLAFCALCRRGRAEKNYPQITQMDTDKRKILICVHLCDLWRIPAISA